MPRWIKNIFKLIAGLIFLVLISVFGVMVYITYNKTKVLKLVNTELNRNMDGTVTVGDMRPQFFKGFPNISLALKNVLVRDRRFAQHHHTFLDAKDLDISVNAWAFLTGTVNIKHVDISNASIDVYTDSTGYSNSSVYKKGQKKQKGASKSSSSAQLARFSLTNVGFRVEDDKKNKLFDFVVNHASGGMAYPDSGWRASCHLDIKVKSMAFNTQNGSFIENKAVEGDLVAGYNEDTGRVTITADALDIGDDPFRIDAVFETGKTPDVFYIHIASPRLSWRHASALLTGNIRNKLDQFNVDKPLSVTALIKGSFHGDGDPLLYVNAKVKDSKVTTPAAILNDCSFEGLFTNNVVAGKGYNDENSIIRLTALTGTYQHIPFSIDTGSIINLSKPIAKGNFKASFPAADLNYLMDGKIARFSKGSADMRLDFSADIVNYELNKPSITGTISLKNAAITYIPGNLLIKNSSFTLNFVGQDLVLKDIRLQTGSSVVYMEGHINNFMNVYYDAPEKILLSWQIHSPALYLGEFLGFLNEGSNNSQNTDHERTAKSGGSNSGNIVTQLNNALSKGNVAMHLDVTNLHYFKFLATDVHADMFTLAHILMIKNAGLKNSGGFLKLNGYIKRDKGTNQLSLNTTVSHVDVRQFFESFDNFGLKDFTSKNLQGTLSARTDITAGITNKATLVPGSVNGSMDVNLKQGALVNFNPIGTIGKFAFPFRNLKNIKLEELNARFDVHGDQFTIHPMKVSSSVLNMDVSGVYGISGGTDIALDVPLRNPKKDTTIQDEEKREKKRYKGIVLHIRAKADSTGKIKVGWNKEHKKD